MLIDLHVHSHLTKGCDLDPRAVLERAASLGLEGVAFTETNTQDGCDELFDLQPKTPLRIFVGLEELSFPMLAIGAAGMMNAVGNLAPGRVAALYEACARGDLAEARRLHFELFDLNRAIFFDTNPIPLKYMMKRIGLLAENTHRLPMVAAR